MTFLASIAPVSATAAGVAVPLSGGFTLYVDILSDWLVRVAIVPSAVSHSTVNEQ